MKLGIFRFPPKGVYSLAVPISHLQVGGCSCGSYSSASAGVVMTDDRFGYLGSSFPSDVWVHSFC